MIQAQGGGKDRTIADNANAEGRANNRRVEMIIDRAENK
jgi:outer membrane protein OmpA-like peptidoglycan-associated protein